MKKSLLLVLLLFPILVFAQATKKIKVKDKPNEELYYVLKSDKTIKHGKYKKSYNGKLIEEGFYKNGVKDSLWTEYSRRNGKKVAQGNYSDAMRFGEWKFYNTSGKLEQQYNYSTGELIFPKFENGYDHIIVEGEDTIKVKADRPPLYLGGEMRLMEFIGLNIKFPRMALENGISGVVIVNFTLNPDGTASNHNVIRGIGGGCDEEAIRVVKLIPNNWLPPTVNGKPISVDYNLPIRFILK